MLHTRNLLWVIPLLLLVSFPAWRLPLDLLPGAPWWISTLVSANSDQNVHNFHSGRGQ
jgi:hypothetical protein